LGWGSGLSSASFTTDGMIEEMIKDWSKEEA
jgi:hypothetical protein